MLLSPRECQERPNGEAPYDHHSNQSTRSKLVRNTGQPGDRLQTSVSWSFFYERGAAVGAPPDARFVVAILHRRSRIYLGVIFVILLPCTPSPAISPFWPKMKA
jgi:hypothetical protein